MCEIDTSSYPILDGNGDKDKPGMIPEPNPGSFNNEKKENLGIQMGHSKKTFKKSLSGIVTHLPWQVLFALSTRHIFENETACLKKNYIY